MDRLADYSNDALLAELRRLSDVLGTAQLTVKDIENHGRCCYELFKQRFGGLRSALNAAGLTATDFNRNVADDELLDELERIWEESLSKDGRRPFQNDLARYHSRFSRHPYYRRWGSWILACEAVLNRAKNQESQLEEIRAPQQERKVESRAKRPIPLRLRYEVLKRDAFSCGICGRSPATHAGVVLHVDHVMPESKGGQAVLENLRTLCEDCNLGKGPLSA